MTPVGLTPWRFETTAGAAPGGSSAACHAAFSSNRGTGWRAARRDRGRGEVLARSGGAAPADAAGGRRGPAPPPRGGRRRRLRGHRVRRRPGPRSRARLPLPFHRKLRIPPLPSRPRVQEAASGRRGQRFGPPRRDAGRRRARVPERLSPRADPARPGRGASPDPGGIPRLPEPRSALCRRGRVLRGRAVRGRIARADSGRAGAARDGRSREAARERRPPPRPLRPLRDGLGVLLLGRNGDHVRDRRGDLPDEERGRRGAERLERLRTDLPKTLGTLLVGNTLANAAAGSLGAGLAISAFGEKWGVLVATILDVDPPPRRRRGHAEDARRAAARGAVAPLRRPDRGVRAAARARDARSSRRSRGGSSARSASTSPADVTEEDVKSVIDLSREQGGLKREESDLLHAVLAFGDTPVRDAMVPRAKIVVARRRVDVRRRSRRSAASTATAATRSRGATRTRSSAILHVKDLFDVSDAEEKPRSSCPATCARPSSCPS